MEATKDTRLPQDPPIAPTSTSTLLAIGDPARGAFVYTSYHNVSCVVFSITPRPFN